MFKKTVLLILVLLSAISLIAEEAIPWRKNITMLVVPREPQVIQVAQDIARRYPVLIVCYQTAPAGPVLHAWNGETWVNVSTADYLNGTFFTTRPRHAVIVEAEDRPAPSILIPDGTWCESGNRLTSTDPRVMIHLLGRYFNFPYSHWMQFSKRYGYSLEEINPALINIFWWHYRGGEVTATIKTQDKEADMDNWFFLDITPPEPIESVVIEEEPEPLPPAETPAKKLVEEPVEETIDVPAEEPVETTAVQEAVAEAVPETPVATAETTVAEIIEVIDNTDSADDINPFSTNDIPAATLILSPAK